jgi:1-acyl-sn-glycerol-3-phosphate acyltransferase
MWIARGLLALAGWRLVGTKPDVPKSVVIAAPHTSNWDGLLMVLAAFGLKARLKWLVKDSLYRFPFSILLKWVGAIPINRRASQNTVEQSKAIFEQADELCLALAPESTRKRTEGWRSGFYYIALAANVPIYFGFIDYGPKSLGIGGKLMPTGDIEADMEQIRAFYQKITPRHPDQYGEIKIAARKPKADDT